MSASETRRNRALVPVLALTLLVGVVAVGSMGIFLVGTDGIENTKSTAETERVEQGFVQLGKEVDTVSLSSQEARTTDFDLEDDAAAVRKKDVGRITITVSDRRDPIVNRSIGALEYREDGTVLAYQAGGVWRGTGRATRMVSAPEIHYNHGSLTLPIMSITGEERISGDRLTASKNHTVSPLNNVSLVEGDLVTITIESEYYAGWAEFFDRRTGSTAVTVDHENETVIVDLGRPSIDGNFDDAVVAEGSIQTTNPNACIDGSVIASRSVDANHCDGGSVAGGGDDVSLQPIDQAINMTLEAARENGDELDADGDAIDNGTYYVDGDLDLDDTLTVDVSDGDVTIVVDGHVKLGNAEIEVVGTGESEGVVRTYVTGDVAIANGNGGVTVENDNPSRFQLYGTSQLHFALGQGSYTGTVYAPRETPADGVNEAAESGLNSANNCKDVDGAPPDVCIGQGNVDFTGAIVAGSMSIEQPAELRYDPRLESTNPSLALDGVVQPPPLTYLHVVVYEIDVTEN